MRLWLDDIRPMPEGFDFHARTASEAIEKLKSGDVTSISFDHDIGEEAAGTGYDVAVWIEEQAFSGLINRLAWSVHSANLVGARKIEIAMRFADSHWTKLEDNL